MKRRSVRFTPYSLGLESRIALDAAAGAALVSAGTVDAGSVSADDGGVSTSEAPGTGNGSPVTPPMVGYPTDPAPIYPPPPPIAPSTSPPADPDGTGDTGLIFPVTILAPTGGSTAPVLPLPVTPVLPPAIIAPPDTGTGDGTTLA